MEDEALRLLCSYHLGWEKRQLCALAGLFPSPRRIRTNISPSSLEAETGSSHQGFWHASSPSLCFSPEVSLPFRVGVLREVGQGGSQASSNGFQPTLRTGNRDPARRVVVLLRLQEEGRKLIRMGLVFSPNDSLPLKNTSNLNEPQNCLCV